MTVASSNEEMTKLNIARFNGKLYGRSKELAILRQAYQRISGCSLQKENTSSDMSNGSKEETDGQSFGNGAQTSPTEMVIVSGRSGVGKSSLIEKLREESTANTDGGSYYFVSGKFDQLRDSQPYSAVSGVLNDLCDIILQSEESDLTSKKTRAKMLSSIRKAVGAEGLKKLAPNVPKVHEIVDDISKKENGCEDEETASVASTIIGESKNSDFLRTRDSFLFNLRSFVRAICSNCCILVMFLDDLQWADPESIHLIRSLLTDTQTRNLLFIGAYREEELDINGHQDQGENKYISTLGDCLHHIETMGIVNLTKIRLGNLDERSINLLISDVLRQDEEETMSLANTVYRKTQGNIFFVLQFLEALQNENLLKYSFLSCKWTWASDDEIQSTMSVSNNVAELMTKKVLRLSKKSQFVLLIAACLGFHFDEDVLKYILKSWQRNINVSIICSNNKKNGVERGCVQGSFRVPKNEDVQPILDIAVEEGFLDEVVGTGGVVVYKFTHDRIQQAALSLLPGGRQKFILHLNIGDLLRKRWLSSDGNAREGNQWLMFVMVNQLNQASYLITDMGKRIELAWFNLQSAELAAASSSFVPASSYLRKAIELLRGLNPWIDHYELMLKICNLSAVMEYSTGNMECCDCIVKEILDNAQTVKDKTNAHIMYMESLLTKGDDLKEVMKFGVRILSLMGEKFPKKVNRYTSTRAFFKTKKMLHNMTDTDLLIIPDAINEEIVAKMEILGYLFACCVMMQSRHFPLIVFRLVQLSVKYGMSKHSSAAFASYGAILCGPFEDKKSGERFARLALSLQAKVDDDTGTLTTYIVHKLMSHWSEHLQKSLDPLLEKYEVGMCSGEIFYALMCAQCYCEHYVNCGMSLSAIENDMRQYHQLMLEYKQTIPLNMLLPVWQYVLNLLGQSEDPLQLTGEAMDQKMYLENATQSSNHINAFIAYSMQMELAYLFGNIGLAVDLGVSAIGHHIEPMLPHHVCRFVCLQGLISLAMARKTRQRRCSDRLLRNTQHRRWQKKSLEAINQVKKWVECKAGNLLHLLLLMNAEHDSLCKNDEIVKRSYDEAIATAGRNGFLSDQALANERAGIFFLERDDQFWASSYLSRSHDLYNEWGARAKVIHMRDKYSVFLRSPSQRASMKGHRGKSRFIDATKHHKEIDVVGICQRQNTFSSDAISD